MAYKYLNDDGLKAYTKKVKGALKDLHTPIAISSENTTESIAQNARNITDFVAKAKAAGIPDVNGMAVTCLIDNDYSGVGYFYTIYNILGVKSTDNLSEHYVFNLDTSGYYSENRVLTATSSNVVTPDMLTQGARKPIILTPSITKVDEETYQKLLSDNVDVMFKAADGNLCGLTYKIEDTDNFEFMFSCFSVEGETAADIFIYGYDVSITKNSPHACFISEQLSIDFSDFLNNSGYITPTALSPVLKEIDLGGTDAERKTELDQFETDWKALTGANDILGARFIGYMGTPSGDLSTIFTWNSMTGFYEGVGTDDVEKIYKIQVNPSAGNIHLTPLFSHLEPVEIFTDNTAESKKKNIDNISAYKANLEQLGVYTRNGYQVPIKTIAADNKTGGVLFYSPTAGLYTSYRGLLFIADDKVVRYFAITPRGEVIEEDGLAFSSDVTTLAQALKDLHTPVPLTATTSTNKTQLNLFLSKVPNAQVMHCTYKDVYAGTLHKINGSWYGVLVSESNTLAGQLSIKLQADGTIIEGTA